MHYKQCRPEIAHASIGAERMVAENGLNIIKSLWLA